MVRATIVKANVGPSIARRMRAKMSTVPVPAMSNHHNSDAKWMVEAASWTSGDGAVEIASATSSDLPQTAGCAIPTSTTGKNRNRSTT